MTLAAFKKNLPDLLHKLTLVKRYYVDFKYVPWQLKTMQFICTACEVSQRNHKNSVKNLSHYYLRV